MFEKFIRRVKLYFRPPFKGDCYYGDPFGYIIGNEIEQVLHGMRNKNGGVLWEAIPSDHCYRLTIEMDSLPYYKCTSEVLAINPFDHHDIKWLKRVQSRRILKEKFHQMIIEGNIEKLQELIF